MHRMAFVTPEALWEAAEERGIRDRAGLGEIGVR